MRILVADDDPSIVALMSHLLIEDHHQVVAARQGDEALALAEQQKFDLIILDVNMPRLTGFEVLREVRRRNPRIPVIMLTIRQAVEDQIEGYKQEADYYIPKPFDTEVFRAYVRSCLKKVH